MKPTKPATVSSSSVRYLPALSFACLGALPVVHAETWDVAAPAAVYSWIDPLNWLGDASFPNGIDATALLSNNLLFNGPGGPQLQGTFSLNLNSAVTLGNLTMGDSATTSGTFQGNGFFTVQNGGGGSLTFESSGPTATLQKTAGSGTTDNITATIILNDPLVADVRTGTINIAGNISGGFGITRAASVTAPVPPVSTGGTLGLSNNTNSYTGDTVIEHGTINATISTDILPSTNSVLGNSANPIVIGNANTIAGSNGTSVLTLTSNNDTNNYTISRGLDFSQGLAPSTSRATLNFAGNGAGSANTNTLTVAGTVALGVRVAQFAAFRSGLTINFTGNITSPATANLITWNGFIQDPGTTPVDGVGAGNFRFSNLARTYAGNQSLSNGAMIIDGVVGALNTASPIGQKQIDLSIGSGGNIVGGSNFSSGAAVARDTSPHNIRSIYLETAGSSYARALAPGNGTVTVATGVTGATTGTTAIPASYGTNSGAAATDADRVSVINGFQFGGLNTTGTVTFSGAINSGSPAVGSHPTNVITTAINMALIAQTGGTVVFGGNINDTSNPSTHSRVTINQFRNHPNLDGNNGTVIGADGIADAAANALVGAATGGTVVLNGINNTYEGTTEVLGGTLQVNGTHTGVGGYTVASGATLGGSGFIDLTPGNGSVVLQAGAALDPGSSPTAGGTLNLNLGSGQLDLAAVAGGTGYLRFGLGAIAASDKVLFTTGAASLGTGLDLDDFAFTNLGNVANGVYTLVETGEPIVGTLGTNLSGPQFGGTVTLSLGDGGTDLILTVSGVVNDYAAWSSGFSLVGGPGDDDDTDGLTNDEEYTFGLIPNSGASVNPFISPLNKSTGLFTYTRRLTSLTGRTYTYESSTTLGGWTPFTPVSVSSDGGNPVEAITVTVPVELLAEPKLFIRVIGQ